MWSLALAVLISAASYSPSTQSLVCSTNAACPGDVVSCDCQNFVQLEWISRPSSDPSQQRFSVAYRPVSMDHIGMVDSDVPGYSVVLLNITDTRFVSQINITLTEALTVMCVGMMTFSTTLHPATEDPSPPLNPHFVLTNSAADNFTVRLEWEAPLDDGGTAIASYQVSVDMSLVAVVSTGTTTILTLNSTGEHHVQVTARNTCNRISQAAISTLNIDSMVTSVSTPTNVETTSSFSSINTETSTQATSKIFLFQINFVM